MTRSTPPEATSNSHPPIQSPFARFLREPLLHFLLLGGVIFGVHAWREKASPAEQQEHIEITSRTVAWLREGFAKQWNREPTVDELRGLVNDRIREEVLYREALALGLERDDTIVRRRMAQKMEFLTQDIAALSPADEPSLRQFFAENSERYAKSPHISFQHIYFSKARRGNQLDADARAALAALGKGVSEETLGDPFLREMEFDNVEADEITAALGGEFTTEVFALPSGQWSGPIPSSYGIHLVRVTARSVAQPVAFEAVREAVARDSADEQRRAINHDFVEQLKGKYRINVDQAALSQSTSLSTGAARP